MASRGKTNCSATINEPHWHQYTFVHVDYCEQSARVFTVSIILEKAYPVTEESISRASKVVGNVAPQHLGA
jgi:hypothetical protein